MDGIDDFIDENAPDDGLWVAVEEEDGDLSIEIPNSFKNETIHEMRRAEEAGADLFSHGDFEASDKYECYRCKEEYSEHHICAECGDCDDCCACGLPQCPSCERVLRDRDGRALVDIECDHTHTEWCDECYNMAQEQREYYDDLGRWWRNTR